MTIGLGEKLFTLTVSILFLTAGVLVISKNDVERRARNCPPHPTHFEFPPTFTNEEIPNEEPSQSHPPNSPGVYGIVHLS